MKKFLIASGVAVLALTSIVAAQSASFQTNLTVGSTGADVTALQTWLIANGYSIPAISAGTATKGYFGSQTKTAVAAYQAHVGLPSTGFVGPLTRGKLNGAAPVVASSACPAGYICSIAPGTTPATPSTPGAISTPGVVGTLAVSLWSTPSGIVAYKGQAYDVASYKVQASASDMAIQNLTLDFDVRIWLYASTVTVKDETGAVVGQVTGLNSGNFSELTVGSQYRLSVPVNGHVVRATQIKYLTVNISFLPTSDRSTGSVNVTQAQIRSVDGTGVTDTQTSSGGSRSFSYQGSGAGSIIITTDSASPATGLVQLSTSAQTQNVLLAIFDAKSQNAPSTLRNLNLVVRTVGSTPSSLFNNLKINAAGLTYSAASTTVSGNTVTYGFTNLTIPLGADVYVPIRVTADAAVNTDNTLDNTIASTTLVAVGTAGGTSNNPVVEDQSFNTLAVNSATFAANNLTFTSSSLTANSLSVSYGTAINNTTTGSSTQQFSFVFTLTAGNNPIYLSANAAVALSTSTAPSGMTVSGVNFSDSDTSGDSAGVYFYLAPGQTKTFTARLQAAGLTSNGGTVQVSSINYGTTTSSLASASLNQSTITNSLKAFLYGGTQ